MKQKYGRNMLSVSINQSKKTFWAILRPVLLIFGLIVVALFILVELSNAIPGLVHVVFSDSVERFVLIAYLMMIFFVSVLMLLDIRFARSLGRLNSSLHSPSENAWLKSRIDSLHSRLRFDLFLWGCFVGLMLLALFDNLGWNDLGGQPYLSIPVIGALVCIGLLTFRFHLISAE